jgi:thymidylate synthase (FAD)
MNERIKYLSAITVEPVRVFANDAWVEEAARISTLSDMKSGDLRVSGGLIRRLMKDRHGTPFEHGGTFTFRVHAPIFVFREWQRHRVGWSYNEQSGRYTEFQPEFYVPSVQRPVAQTGKPMDYDMQRGTEIQKIIVDKLTKRSTHHAWENYKAMLAAGISREVARNALPVSTYSSMYATCNPRSLMNFLALRTEVAPGLAAYPSHPQWEIRAAANEVEAAFKEAMPITWTAWDSSGRVAP